VLLVEQPEQARVVDEWCRPVAPQELDEPVELAVPAGLAQSHDHRSHHSPFDVDRGEYA
jgi:hypothetical protein